ncbi:MAG: SDR family NAD(P)-dependent oxidoreductase [Burkholderiaceae bacterium]|nr:SDR family NAD(P)-dependent oxidoreductase [Burkholderiaceae bacterium]
MKARELDSRVVVVTGAAGGLGRALCTAFAVRGARIAAPDVDEQALERLHSELALPELLAVRCGYAASKHALHGCFETLRAE